MSKFKPNYFQRRSKPQGPKSNQQIRAIDVQVIGSDGNNLGILPLNKAIEKAKEAGKPEDMLEKIATGTVNKFLKEVTLLNQAFVKDDKLSIQDLLKKSDATVHAFTMYSVGEGIEKKQEDFAAEVAAASKV